MSKIKVSLWLFHSLALLLVACLATCVVLITGRLGNILEWNDFVASPVGKKTAIWTYQKSCLNMTNLKYD